MPESNGPKWKDLDGAQRFEIVELARKPDTSIKDLCRTFGVSRQTLHRAISRADQASMEALTAKRRGRPAIPPQQKELTDLQARNKQLESDLKRERLKNEVAMALLELHRKTERRQRMAKGKKNRGAGAPKPQSGTDGDGTGS